MKIAIIGCGQATFGLLKAIEDTPQLHNAYIDIYDENPFGNSGLQYDGKLVIGQYSGTDEYVSLQQQLYILKFYLSLLNDKSAPSIEQLKDKINDIYIRYYNFYENNLYVAPQVVYHLGTDQLQLLNCKLIEHFQRLRQIHHPLFTDNDKISFKFNTRITPQFDLSKYDKVVYAVGRRGTTLLNQFKNDPKYIENNTKVDLGIRFELSSNFPDIKRLDEQLYEWKIKYKTSNNMMVRTFCHNPHGYVSMQNVEVLGDNIKIVNGHAFKNKASNNTNFAILVSHTFTQPFNDSVLFGKSISQMANLLAGGDKVILQTLGDFMDKKRTKKLFRILPTLDVDKYILGDLSFVFPTKTYNAIVQFLTTLSKQVPSVLFRDNLLYGVEAKFYNMSMKNTDRDIFIGDCSGHSRSIIAATCHGYNAVKQLLKV